MLILALIGFADAIYITVEHFSGVIPPCAIGGCETVLTSKYSEILGIPVSLLGAIYYFIISLSLFIYFDTKKDIFLKFPLVFSVCGLLASIYFVSLMIFVLKALCLYCALSATTSISIFAISAYTYKKYG
ncbi:MAG: vitamin K epoxide reductase family protein [Candidatus Taylorbacteria bacterium]|nr:vitamin K epoxide reductase family protein [Candidatus Taylorbacteria bacterium]